MKFLLDTHIWLWSLLEPFKLSPPIRQALESDTHDVFLSPISVWETLVLAEKQRIVLHLPAQQWVQEALLNSRVHEAPLTYEIALKSRVIVLPHEDPADRFIAATAWEYGLTLITQDSLLKTATQIRIF